MSIEVFEGGKAEEGAVVVVMTRGGLCGSLPWSLWSGTLVGLSVQCQGYSAMMTSGAQATPPATPRAWGLIIPRVNDGFPTFLSPAWWVGSQGR